MMARSNGQWLQALNGAGESRAEALEALREYLMRAVSIYLRQHRSDLSGWTSGEIRCFAEDAAQEALLSIRANLERFRGDSKFTTWAYRFAINQAARELRLSRHRDVSLDGLQESDVATFARLVETNGGPDPLSAAEQHDCIALLKEIIEHDLTDRQRLAIVGVYLQGRSMDGVAGQLDISRNALYKLLHDARLKIKARLHANSLTAGDVLAAFEP